MDPSLNNSGLLFNTSSSESSLTEISSVTLPPDFKIAPVYLFCCAISLAVVSAFLRSGFILKLVTMSVSLISQVFVLHYCDLFEQFNLLYREEG